MRDGSGIRGIPLPSIGSLFFFLSPLLLLLLLVFLLLSLLVFPVRLILPYLLLHRLLFAIWSSAPTSSALLS